MSKAEADKRARARARRPGGQKDEKLKALQDANAKADKQVRVTENLLAEFRKGIAAKLG